MYFGTVWTVWAPKKMHPKKFFNTFSIYISRKTWMKYSLRIHKNKNLFKRLNQISFPKCIEHQIFLDTQLNYWGFLGITKLSNP